MKNLAEFLFKTFPSAKYASGKKEIVMRCPFCGDSKNIGSAHFYISLIEGQPHFYHCFKCNESGILSSKVLRKMQVYDVEESIALDLYNKSIETKIPVRNNLHRYFLKTDFISDNELSRAKLAYLNHRLGSSITLDDCKRLKIILNLYDLLNRNNIRTLTRDRNIVNQLNDSFLGFLSVDNAFVNLRNLREGKVHKNIDRRYIDYNIFGKADNSQRAYVVPTTVNTIDPNPVNIHIAEGAIDILSVFLNLNNGNTYQNIYSSMGGKQYLNQVIFYITEYGLFNSIFHLYVDNDIEDHVLRKIKERVTPLNIPVYIHRNGHPGEKDYGVKREKIIDRVYLL